MSFSRSAILLAAACAVAACSDTPTEPPAGPAAGLEVVSVPLSLPVNTTATNAVKVRVLDADRRPVPNVPVTWLSALIGPTTTTFTDSKGTTTVTLISGIQAGAVQVFASTPTPTGTAALTFTVDVTPGPAAEVRVSPGPSMTMGRYGQRQLVAVVYDAFANPLPGPTVTWASSNGATAAVSSTGVVTAAAPGNATLTASSGSAHAAVAVTVLAAMIDDDFDGENGGVARFNYGALKSWSVERPGVDLIGAGSPWDFVPGHGLYLDLDGEYAGGRIESRDAFALPAGTYTLSFNLAGSQRGDTNTVTVSVGTLFSEQFTRLSGDGFIPVTRTITVPAGGATVRVAFDQPGNDGYGALLDDVLLVKN